jgi:hypothetical protein
MFDRNKKDPLVDAVKGVMQVSESDRKAIAHVNKTLGIQSRRQLPHNKHAAYDRAVAEAQKAAVAGTLTETTQLTELKESTEKKAEPLNAWGQDAKTAKAVRKQLRMERKHKAYVKRLKRLTKEDTEQLGEDRDSDLKGRVKKANKEIKHAKNPSVSGELYRRLISKGGVKRGSFDDRQSRWERVKDRTQGEQKNRKKQLKLKLDETEISLASIQEEIRSHLLSQMNTMDETQKTQFVASLTEEQAEIMGFNEQEITKDNFVPNPSPTGAGGPNANLTVNQPMANQPMAAPGKVSAPSVPANAPAGTQPMKSVMQPQPEPPKPAMAAKPATTAKPAAVK